MQPERKSKLPNAKRALANEIAQAIRLRLYRPGEWLRQIDLEEKFQATRFDVRSALEELAIRQTIEHVPNRGYRVAEVDMKTYKAIRATRVILERATAPGIVQHIDAPAIARLRVLAQQFSEAVHGGTPVEQSEINRAFHQLIYSFCGNPVLEETIWSLRDRSRGTHVTVWRSHEALLKSDRDHYAMIDALEARDATGLAELIAGHIIKNMDETEAPGRPATEIALGQNSVVGEAV